MSAGAAVRPALFELEDDLTNARHMAVMVQWIGVARDFIEGVRWTAKTRPGLADELRVAGVWITDPEWGECEGDALRHLNQSSERCIRDIEKKVGLGSGGVR